MSQLKAHEKVIFERLFDRGGYVLDFTDRTYAEFLGNMGSILITRNTGSMVIPK